MPHHETWRFVVENHSRKLYSNFSQLVHLLKICHTTYFYTRRLEGRSGYNVVDITVAVHYLFFYPSSAMLDAALRVFTKSAKAIDGSGCFIKFSPIRKPVKPNCLKRTIVSASFIPLSEIFILFAGIF